MGKQNKSDKSHKIPKLSAKEAAFVRNFLKNGFNATKAYKSAGYKPKTAASAHSCASKLLSKAKVQQAIKEEMFKEEQKLQEEYEISKDSIRRELALIGFAHSKRVLELEQRRKKQIEGLDPDSDSYPDPLDITTNDKIRSLESLGKYVGLANGSGDKDEDSEDRQDIENEVSRTIEKL